MLFVPLTAIYRPGSRPPIVLASLTTSLETGLMKQIIATALGQAFSFGFPLCCRLKENVDFRFIKFMRNARVHTRHGANFLHF